MTGAWTLRPSRALTAAVRPKVPRRALAGMAHRQPPGAGRRQSSACEEWRPGEGLGDRVFLGAVFFEGYIAEMYIFWGSLHMN
jgi:hypothetical protein